MDERAATDIGRVPSAGRSVRAVSADRPRIGLLEAGRLGDGPHLFDALGRGVGAVHCVDDHDRIVYLHDPERIDLARPLVLAPRDAP